MKNKRIFILRAGIILSVIILLFELYGVIIAPSMSSSPQGSPISNANIGAKLIFTNTRDLFAQLENNGVDISEINGLYCGSLIPGEENTVDLSGKYSAEIYDHLYKQCGGNPNAGYYFMITENGTISQTYWSENKILLDSTDDLIKYANADRGERNDFNIFLNKQHIGSYPNYTNNIPKFDETTNNILLTVTMLAFLYPLIISIIIYRITAPKKKSYDNDGEGST